MLFRSELLKLVDSKTRTNSVVSDLRFDAEDDRFAAYPPNERCLEQKMSMLKGISPAEIGRASCRERV